MFSSPISSEISPSPSGSEVVSVTEVVVFAEPVSSIKVFPPPAPLLLTPPPPLGFEDDAADEVLPVVPDFDEVSLSPLPEDVPDESFELSDFEDVSLSDEVLSPESDFEDVFDEVPSLLLVSDVVSECESDEVSDPLLSPVAMTLTVAASTTAMLDMTTITESMLFFILLSFRR